MVLFKFGLGAVCFFDLATKVFAFVGNFFMFVIYSNFLDFSPFFAKIKPYEEIDSIVLSSKNALALCQAFEKIIMIFCLFVQNLFLKTKLPDNESSVEWRKTDTPVNEDRFQAGVDGGVASLLIGVQHSHLHC